MQDKVYKIFTEDEWALFQETGEFSGSADDLRDGFIHLSTREQVDGVIEKFFANKGPLHVAEFSTFEFAAMLRWEKTTSGETYPHLMGAKLFLNKVSGHTKI